MNESIDSLMNEKRRFAPTEEFARNALVDESHYAEAADDRLEFWAKRARELHWHEDFTEVLDWQPRTPSGSRTARSTSPTTASTGMSKPATATASPSTGRASPATSAPSPTPT